MDETVELGALGPCFLNRVADDDEGCRQDLQMRAVTPDGGHTPLDIGIKRLRTRKIAGRTEDQFGRFCRELPSRLGLTGLHDHRPALNWPGNIQRPAHAQFITLVVEHVHLFRIEEDTALLITDESIIRETVPEAG